MAVCALFFSLFFGLLCAFINITAEDVTGKGGGGRQHAAKGWNQAQDCCQGLSFMCIRGNTLPGASVSTLLSCFVYFLHLKSDRL